MVDGTFKTTPKISKNASPQIPYDQVWIISAVFAPSDPLKWTMEALPCVYVLKPGKKASTETYSKVLKHIKEKAKEIGVDLSHCDWNVMMDFEKAERNAFQQVFPNTAIFGCGFHYCQALLKNIGDHGLLTLYRDRDNPKFRYYIRKYMMLMLLPSHMVQETWVELKRLAKTSVPAGSKNQFSDWLQYHKSTWMDGTYNIDDWNRWKNKLGTNNLAEIFNCRLSQVLGSHPSLVDWVTEIQKQLALTISRSKQLDTFGKTHWKATQERYKDSSLQLLSEKLEKKEIEPINFLELCSKAMKFHYNSIEAELKVDLSEWIQNNIS